MQGEAIWRCQHSQKTALSFHQAPALSNPLEQNTARVPGSQPAHDEGHINYMPCPDNTCSQPRWQVCTKRVRNRAPGDKKERPEMPEQPGEKDECVQLQMAHTRACGNTISAREAQRFCYVLQKQIADSNCEAGITLLSGELLTALIP